jgi:PAS domain S-box-containing protein
MKPEAATLAAEALDLVEVCITKLDGTITYWSRGMVVLYGYTAEEAVGRVNHALLQTEFPLLEPLATAMAKLSRDGRWNGELIHRTRDGRRLPVLSRWRLYHQDGETFMMEASTDISALREAEDAHAEAERLHGLVTLELGHRMKNLLAVVQAAVGHTLRACWGDPVRLRRDLGGRLAALARAHDIVAHDASRPTNFAALAKTALATWPEIDLTGCDPDVLISPQQAQLLVLALHELGTNATKYGALAQPGGNVTVRCAPSHGLARVEWIEEGGPAPSPEVQHTAGFGMRLLRDAIPRQLGTGAMVDLAFTSTGLRAMISFKAG